MSSESLGLPVDEGKAAGGRSSSKVSVAVLGTEGLGVEVTNED